MAAGAANDIRVARTHGLDRMLQGLTAFDLALRFRKTLEGHVRESGELLQLLERADGSDT
jgi:hypothetical protein